MVYNTSVILQRSHENKYGTHGYLMLDWKHLCFTLEEPWKDNKKFVSCVPPEVYRCKHHDMVKKDVWRLLDVPGRTGILIHAGNDLEDTEGCILVGLGVYAEGVTRSQDALKLLRATLPKRFLLDIKPIGVSQSEYSTAA